MQVRWADRQLESRGGHAPGRLYSPTSEATRNTVEAERLTRAATELMHEDPAQAEAILREALTADLFFGPAHNNLGVLFLKQGKRYDAAAEFEWARKLMPGHPDPRVNLAMTLEEAGRVDDALASYSAALQVAPQVPACDSGVGAALSSQWTPAGSTRRMAVRDRASVRVRGVG